MKTTLTMSLMLAACIPFAASADDLRAAGDVGAALTAAGYAEVREIEFDDGLWEAEVRRADGRWGEVHVDPASGEILDGQATTPMLDAAGVRAALEAAGYSAIGDLDRDGATWDADATDARGQRVELRISGADGHVLHSDVDWDD
jgi:hypothetical protein